MPAVIPTAPASTCRRPTCTHLCVLTCGFLAEKAAKAARDEARVGAHRAEFVDRNTVTVAQYLTTWLETHEVWRSSLRPSPATGTSWRAVCGPEHWFHPAPGRAACDADRLCIALRSTGGRRGEGLSARTVDHVHAVLRRALNDAVRVDRLLTSNPAERAKRPRRDPAGPRSVWSPDELASFLAVAQSHRLFPFFRLAAYSGARRGELLNLRWADVDTLTQHAVPITFGLNAVWGRTWGGSPAVGGVCRPEAGDGHCPDPVAEVEWLRTGVEDDPAHEPGAELLA